MASAGITALLKKMDYKDVVVAIDGSVFRFDSNNKNGSNNDNDSINESLI